MTARTFTRDELKKLDVPYNAVHTEVIDEGRWSIYKRSVFEADGHFWAVEWSAPATEMQEGQDIWDGALEVAATEVVLVPFIVNEWVEVTENTAPNEVTQLRAMRTAVEAFIAEAGMSVARLTLRDALREVGIEIKIPAAGEGR